MKNKKINPFPLCLCVKSDQRNIYTYFILMQASFEMCTKVEREMCCCIKDLKSTIIMNIT